MDNSLILALIGSVTSLLVAAIGFCAAVRAAKLLAFVQLCRNVDLAMRQRGVADPTPLELAALTEGLRTIRGPIKHEYKRAQIQSDFLCARMKDAGFKSSSSEGFRVW